MENSYAEILWDYHHMNQDLLDSVDCILALGSHDLHVAERAAELYLKGISDLIIFSGGLGRITQKIWGVSEAEKFREVAIMKGVPRENILIECNSTNTGENLKNTWRLLEEKRLKFNSFIIVDKPYKERRAFATFNKQWPIDVTNVVTSPQYSFSDYCDFYKSGEITVHEFFSIMVGDLQRIDLYGKNGFQVRQEIPKDVWDAYNHLIEMGFTDQLIKNM